MANGHRRQDLAPVLLHGSRVVPEESAINNVYQESVPDTPVVPCHLCDGVNDLVPSSATQHCAGAPPDTKPPPPLQRRLERKQGGIQKLARMVGRSHQVLRACRPRVALATNHHSTRRSDTHLGCIGCVLR